jgi:hypothetical protein
LCKGANLFLPSSCEEFFLWRLNCDIGDQIPT